MGLRANLYKPSNYKSPVRDNPSATTNRLYITSRVYTRHLDSVTVVFLPVFLQNHHNKRKSFVQKLFRFRSFTDLCDAWDRKGARIEPQQEPHNDKTKGFTLTRKWLYSSLADQAEQPHVVESFLFWKKKTNVIYAGRLDHWKTQLSELDIDVCSSFNQGLHSFLKELLHSQHQDGSPVFVF